jgi:hypothetical protein
VSLDASVCVLADILGSDGVSEGQCVIVLSPGLLVRVYRPPEPNIWSELMDIRKALDGCVAAGEAPIAIAYVMAAMRRASSPRPVCTVLSGVDRPLSLSAGRSGRQIDELSGWDSHRLGHHK